MRIAVVSCWKYRDAWEPFIRLFRKHWPDCPHPFYLVTDEYETGSQKALGEIVWISRHKEWAKSIAEYCEDLNDPILLLQEDFFLNAPVNSELVDQALTILRFENVGAVRLYPCPGSTETSGNGNFGPVAAAFEISHELPGHDMEACVSEGHRRTLQHPGGVRDSRVRVGIGASAGGSVGVQKGSAAVAYFLYLFRDFARTVGARRAGTL